MKTIIALFITVTALANEVKTEHKVHQHRPLIEERGKTIVLHIVIKDGKVISEERKISSKEDRKKLGPPGRPPKKD